LLVLLGVGVYACTQKDASITGFLVGVRGKISEEIRAFNEG